MADLSSAYAIVKQELIIDDLELHDYEHLLREFYCDQPEMDHVPTAEEQVKVELPDVEETSQERFIVENPFAVQNEARTLALGSDGLWHCPICARTYKWKAACEAHINKHRRCEACSITFTTPAAFANHNRIQHGIVAPPPVIQTNSSPTKSPGEPRPHDPTVSPGKRRLTPIIMQRDENGLFTCPECGKSFEKDNSYFVHVRRHKDKQKERFFCEPCAKVFTSNFSLKQHCVKYHGLVQTPRQAIIRIEPVQTENNNHQHVPPEPVQACIAPSTIPDEPPAAPLESDSYELLIEIFDEEVAHLDEVAPRDEVTNGSDGQMDLVIQEDIPCFDLVSSSSTEDVPPPPSSVIVKEEVAMEVEGSDDDGTALVDVLHSRVEYISEFPSGGGFKRTAKPVQRPEYAQRCPVCKVWYHTEAGLEKHLRRHEDFDQRKSRKLKVPMKVEIPKVKSAPKIKPDFYCERCDKSYGSKHKYYLHKARHTNIDSERFKCPQCSKALGSKQELILHERRTHEASVPPKSDEENLADLLKQAKPCTIQLDDILLQQEEKFKKTLLKQINPARRHVRQKKGRAKGSRKCPMCYEWFLTQDELKEHYSVHLNNDKSVLPKREEKKVNIKIKGKIQPIRPTVKQAAVRDEKKVKLLKPEPIVPERRKPGRPPGSRNLSNKLELKPKLLERRTAGRTYGSLSTLNAPQLKPEPTVSKPRKVERPSLSQNSLSTSQLKSDASSSECKKRGRPPGPRASLNLKSEQNEPVCKKRGRPKGSREHMHLLDQQFEVTTHERRKSERPMESQSNSEDGSKTGLKPNDLEPKSSQQEPRKVGRPRKSQNSPTVSPTKEKPSSIKRKRGRPKKELKVNPLATSSTPYCAQCDKKFTTHLCLKLHNLRHQNVDSGRFKCDPCSKAFASKAELDSHVGNGHKSKVGRPKRMLSSSPEPLPKATLTKLNTDNPPVQMEQPNVHRKPGRPRKNQLLASNFGRPKGSKKCPLCKIWSRSAHEFKEHLRSHI